MILEARYLEHQKRHQLAEVLLKQIGEFRQQLDSFELALSVFMGNSLYNEPTESLEFPIGIVNILHSNEIHYIGDLVQCTEGQLRGMRGISPKSIQEIKEVLAVHGLGLGTRLEHWHTPRP